MCTKHQNICNITSATLVPVNATVTPRAKLKICNTKIPNTTAVGVTGANEHDNVTNTSRKTTTVVDARQTNKPHDQ